MTKKGFSYIGMILDRSGSMDSIRKDVIGGVRTFISDQKKVPGKAVMSLYQFDDKYQVDYEAVDIQSVPEFTEESFIPRGSTALLDAVGRTTVGIGAAIAKMPEEERPDQVLLVIFTDGAENHSTEYTIERIREMLKIQQEVYKWKVLFLGANIDAVSTGAKYGMKGMNFSGASGSQGMLRSMKAASAYVGSSRLGDSKTANAIYASNDANDSVVRSATEAFDNQLKNEPAEKSDDSSKTP